MKTFKNILAGFAAATVLVSCFTDFDIIAPYEEHTIVFGLMDQNDNIQWIKINKSFLGDGNAYDMAAIRDSSEYDLVVGNVEAWAGGVLQATYPLRDTVVTNRDSGVFYYPEQTLYYFNATLNDAYEYRLNLQVGENGKEVSGRTNLVKNTNFTGNITAFSFAYSTSSITGVYPPNSQVRFNTGQYGKRYDTWLHFWYDEYTASGVERKDLSWKIDNYITLSTNGGENRTITFDGDAFYRYVSQQIHFDANVIKRIPRQMDIQIVAASEDLYTYMKLNEPSTGIVQEKPSFTNLTDAIGLFSSRYTKWIRGKVLNKDSMNELAMGQFTNGLQFCSDSLIWAAEPCACP